MLDPRAIKEAMSAVGEVRATIFRIERSLDVIAVLLARMNADVLTTISLEKTLKELQEAEQIAEMRTER